MGPPLHEMQGLASLTDGALASIKRANHLAGAESPAPYGPAEAYQAIGLSIQLVHHLSHMWTAMGTCLEAEQHRGALRVSSGPFSGEPDAAVAVTTMALRSASRVCLGLHDPLERAQMSCVDLERPAARRRGP